MSSRDKIRFAARTDIGRRRQNNEDSFMVLSGENNAYVVILADGMGGHNRGELASSIAVKYVADRLAEDMYNDITVERTAKLIAEIIEKANVKVYLKSLEDPANAGMGTTLTVGIFLNSRLIIGHVGDCRVCLLRRRDYLHLTVDHTLVQLMVDRGEVKPEDAPHHPHRNVVTRALGTPEYMFADVSEFTLEKGDRFIFSSDGLHDYVPEKLIEETVRQAAGPREAVDRLIALANEAGGSDNVTVIAAYL